MRKANNQTKNCLIGTISFLLICIIVICCIGVIFSDTDLLSTPTPFILIPIETIVEETYSAARFQTLSVATLIPPPATFTPIDLTPTVLYPVTIYPATLAPTWTPIPTFTPFILSTQPISTAAAVCSCSGDLYDCKDFSTHAQAQACFDLPLPAQTGYNLPISPAPLGAPLYRQTFVHPIMKHPRR